jgi:DNA-binding beta-propeller fold protein YncE
MSSSPLPRFAAPLLALSLLPASLATAQDERIGRDRDVLVSGFTSNSVHRFDVDGAFLERMRGLRGAQSMRYGPGGDLYICAELTDRVLRLSHRTGKLTPFVFDDPMTPGNETGGLDAPTAAVFGPDGDLYVASFSRDEVLRYDGVTGAYVGRFVPPRRGGLDGPDAGMCFGPDGHLYVPSFNNHRVLVYNGTTGAFRSTLAGPGQGGLRNPRMLRWKDDLWYVSSWGSNAILRYDALGNFVDRFIQTNRPTGFVFRPPHEDVLVTSDNRNRVLRFDDETGALLGTLVPQNGGGLRGGTYIELLRPNSAQVFGNLPGPKQGLR